MHSIYRYNALAFTLAFAAGCQTAKPIAMSVAVTPTATNIQNGDVLAPQRRAGLEIPPLHGTEIVTIRTYETVMEKTNGRSSTIELENIGCQVQSDGYTASIKTPAEVRVPDYGYASRPISVQCNAAGYKPAFKSRMAYNKTTKRRMSGAHNGGLIGVVAVAVINAASDEKKHDFG
jgi:hypothetical protein